MNIHRHDDFILNLTPAPSPSIDFEGEIFSLAEPARTLRFIKCGTDYEGCTPADGGLLVPLSRHRLPAGRLCARILYRIPDPLYPGGIRHNCMVDDLHITLTVAPAPAPADPVQRDITVPASPTPPTPGDCDCECSAPLSRADIDTLLQ